MNCFVAGCVWGVLQGVYGVQGVLQGVYGVQGVLQGVYGVQGVLQGVYGVQGVLQGVYGIRGGVAGCVWSMGCVAGCVWNTGVCCRVCMEYGGSDISRCFHWLLTRAGLPYKQCDVTDRMDTLLLQELKETYCHLDQVRQV